VCVPIHMHQYRNVYTYTHADATGPWTLIEVSSSLFELSALSIAKTR